MNRSRLAAALPLLLAAAPAPPLMPGAWQETIVFALDQVNGSAALAQRMGQALTYPPPRQERLTAADLQNPQALFLAGAEQSCRFTRFAMADGRIEAVGDCADGHGRTMHVAGRGTYTPTGYDFAFTGTGGTNGLALAFRGRDSGRRTGLCTAF